jgi:hypothetical protein
MFMQVACLFASSGAVSHGLAVFISIMSASSGLSSAFLSSRFRGLFFAHLIVDI